MTASTNKTWFGGNGTWSTAGNWRNDDGTTSTTTPGTTAIVYFNGGGTITAGSQTVTAVVINGDVTFAGTGFTASNRIEVYANVTDNMTSSVIVGSSTGSGYYISGYGYWNHASGAHSWTIYGDLGVNLDQHSTAGTMNFIGPAAASFSSGGTRHSVTITKNSGVQFTMYSDANCTRSATTSRLNHTGGWLNLNGVTQTCTGWAASGTRQITQNADINCTGSSGTLLNQSAPTTCYSREGVFRVYGSGATTVALGTGTAGDGSTVNNGAAIGTAPQLVLQNNVTYTTSGYALNVYCDGTMTGSITTYTSFTGTNNNNMTGLTLTYSNLAAGETRDFSWTGQLGSVNFTPAVGTGCTYNINYLRCTGSITAQTNSTNYYFNDVQWTSSVANCSGASSYYRFSDGTYEIKWTTGGLTCSGNASTYDFNWINPTGTSTLTCSASAAVGGVSATYNYNYVRGTAALAITVNGLGTNVHNVYDVTILGAFTFTVSTLNLYNNNLNVLSFLSNSGSGRTINFNDFRIITSGSGYVDFTTVTNFSHNRGNGGLGGIQLGGSGASVFGAANTTQSLRVWIERSGSTSITSGNVRSLVLNNGTLSGTVTVNVEGFSSETTGSARACSALNLTLSSTDINYQTFNQPDLTFTSLSLTGAGSWTVQNLTASTLACNASNSAFYIGYPNDNGPGFCNITSGTATVTLTGTNTYFYLYNIAGKVLTATSGSNNYYSFEFTDGAGTERGFTTSVTMGASGAIGGIYDLKYIHQNGYLSLAGTPAVSTYNFYDVVIRNTTYGVYWSYRGNFNLYNDLYTAQLNIGGFNDTQKVLNFLGDGVNYRNIYVSGPSGSTQLNMSNLSGLTIPNRGDADNGIIVINNWFSTGAASVALVTSGAAANGANVPSIRIDGVKPSVGTGSVYHFKNFRGDFDTAGGVSNTAQTITVYGNLYISDTPYLPSGSIGASTFTSTNFIMGRTDSTGQTIQTQYNPNGYTPPDRVSLRIGTLTVNGVNTITLVDYTQVTTLILTNGRIDLNYSQLYVQTLVTITNNTNQKYIYLTGNDIYIAATTGSVWNSTDTNYLNCYGDGNVQLNGGTVNNGATTRKYNDQVNFYMNSGTYTLTSPFTCRNLTTNNYTPPASWTLYIGGSLAWNWAGVWTAPTGTINFVTTNGSGTISSDRGQNASYTFPTINVQNGFTLQANSELTFSTMNVTGNSTFDAQFVNILCLTLLNINSGTLKHGSYFWGAILPANTITFAGSGGTQTTTGLYMSNSSTITNSGSTPVFTKFIFTGSGEKYFTIPNSASAPNLINSGAFNSGTLAGYLNIYNSISLDAISNTVNPSGFRQQTGSSNLNIGSFGVTGTSGALAYWRNPASATMTKTTATNVGADYMSIANSTVTNNGSGQLWYAGANSTDNGGNSGWIFSSSPTYSLAISGGATTVNEGSSFTVVLTTTGVSNGTTVPYTISGTGITTADISGTSLTDNFIISSGSASATFSVTADNLTEGTERFTLALNNGQASVYIDILDTSIAVTYSLAIQGGYSSVNEGSSFTVVLTTTGVSDGTNVPYAISGTGITTADLSGASLTGNFTVSGGSSNVTFNVANDYLTEGPETFTLTLTGLGNNVSITLNDTSTTPKAGGNFLLFFPI